MRRKKFPKGPNALALMKQLRYKAVEQKNAQLCRPGIPLRGQVSSP
jgi:hypothetical protein